MPPILYYIHDPMCSWCWGYRPTWQKVREQLPRSITLTNVLGGLAPDTDEPMPEGLQQQIQSHWRRIQSLLGTEFNFDFWTNNQPRRATYIACRAVIAASNQGAEEAMIEAIQKAYYLRTLNPSDTNVLIQLSQELGLNTRQFAQNLESEETHSTLREQLALTRSLPIAGFPSLVLKVGEDVKPIQLDYQDHQVTLADIIQKISLIIE